MSEVNRIIIHHTADPSNYPQFYRVNEWHKLRQFPKSSLGFYCGYTYLIERDGKVITARKDTEEQAHTKGLNQDSIGIGLAGDFTMERPTEEQLFSLKQLINAKMKEYAISPNNISGHRMFADTLCPGNKVSEAELKALFQPDLSYIAVMILHIRQLIASLQARILGSKMDDKG